MLSVKQLLESLYPDFHRRTICVPPVHFNRVPYVRGTVSGTGQFALVQYSLSAGDPPVHDVPRGNCHRSADVPSAQYSLWSQKPQPLATPVRIQETDVLDDFAQNHLLLNLQELGIQRGEVMFILSQLSFGSYLNQPSYAAAVAGLPKPTDLDPRYQWDGEWDVVLIHRRHGILLGELKSVGSSKAGVIKTQAQADADVAKRVGKAVSQLDRSESVVRHIVNDVAPDLTVVKTLLLPYVPRSQLVRVLTANSQLEQNVCQTLGAGSGAEAAQLCVCSDDLSDPETYWNVTSALLSSLDNWWQRRVACVIDTSLDNDTELYMHIAARFVGPATTVHVHCTVPPRVQVRTEGEAVSELGRRLTCLVLTPQQLDLMNRAPPRVYITGPPGTGKTVCLVLIGLRWLLQGHDVHVVCSRSGTFAVSSLIQHQLQSTLSEHPAASAAAKVEEGASGGRRVCLHSYDLYSRETDVDVAVRALSREVSSGGRALHVLLDEAHFSGRTVGARYRKLVKELNSRVPDLHLWAACIGHKGVAPELQTEILTTPLRCSPVVVREIQSVLHRFSDVASYSDSGVPAPGDGLPVARIRHHGNGHDPDESPLGCYACGQSVAAELRRLGVGVRGNGSADAPEPLQYRDVFVLTRSTKLQDDVTDDAGKVTSPASAVVRGLRDAGLPVWVVGSDDWHRDLARWQKEAVDVAVAGTDRVTVSHYGPVSGLERKVVVWLPDRAARDVGLSDEDVEARDRLYVLSRCTTQLVMVHVPRGNG